jgi:RNA polymerase sigma-70 factor (ECF subfamily)
MTPDIEAVAYSSISRAPDRFARVRPASFWHLPLAPAEAAPVAVPAVDLQAYLAAHYARLHRRLQRHLGCNDLARECLHDAWLRLGERGPQAAPENPEAYVFRVACNLAMDSLRARSRSLGADDAQAGVGLEVVADQGPGPELIAEARSEVAAVDRAMQRLPRRHQSVLLALRWHEMSRQEVALRHGVSVRKIDTALRQALGELR